ncbi:MAG: transcription termination factor NusA, partial [Thermoanaerobaculaceae bacterium]|nr:transcription termination factor NusA [Thermoanaerobaculaceae bacterium]
NFGRIAAQTAKQAILQKIRQTERTIVYEEYKDRVGDIVSGSVRRFERGDIVVDLGRAEAVMPSKERIPTEEYQIGDRVRAFVLAVQDNTMGPAIILSRAHPDFVRRLFAMEVAEIADKTVEIRAVAREAGYRTKIAVISHEEKVDPVGACVGMRGIRVKNIVRELSGEKIDIVRWSDDVRTYVTNALSPAKLLRVNIDAEARVVYVVTDPEQLSLAIGKRGQNVRLASRLLGCRIEIKSEETVKDEVAAALAAMLRQVEGLEEEAPEAETSGPAIDYDSHLPLEELSGISDRMRERLIEHGFSHAGALAEADPATLMEIPGIGPHSAAQLIQTAKSALAAQAAAGNEE